MRTALAFALIATALAACSDDPCGACPQQEQCVQLSDSPGAGTSVCAVMTCGESAPQERGCPQGETCRTVSYDPCAGHCSTPRVTEEACIVGVAPDDVDAQSAGPIDGAVPADGSGPADAQSAGDSAAERE
jgi:hypothetical protein